jgi:hypothetical protein
MAKDVKIGAFRVRRAPLIAVGVAGAVLAAGGGAAVAVNGGFPGGRPNGERATTVSTGAPRPVRSPGGAPASDSPYVDEHGNPQPFRGLTEYSFGLKNDAPIRYAERCWTTAAPWTADGVPPPGAHPDALKSVVTLELANPRTMTYEFLPEDVVAKMRSVSLRSRVCIGTRAQFQQSTGVKMRDIGGAAHYPVLAWVYAEVVNDPSVITNMEQVPDFDLRATKVDFRGVKDAKQFDNEFGTLSVGGLAVDEVEGDGTWLMGNIELSVDVELNATSHAAQGQPFDVTDTFTIDFDGVTFVSGGRDQGVMVRPWGGPRTHAGDQGGYPLPFTARELENDGGRDAPKDVVTASFRL